MAPNARAGSYVGAYAVPVVPATNPVTYTQIPYSQGTHYTPGQTGFGNYPDTLSNGSYGGSSGGGTYSDCSGAIYTSWTWVPATGQTMITDPPPSQVIIMQTCSVSVGLGQPGGSGTYDDGLGTSGSASFNPPTSTGGSGTDTHYSVQTGGATVTLSAVNAKAHVTNAPSSASVSYTATISPVFVIPSGAIKDSSGNYNILVGQGCTSSLTGIPTGCTVSNYSWSVQGATFQVWQGVQPSTVPPSKNPNSSYYVDGPGVLTNSTAHWYWHDIQGTYTVSCTATVTPPTGQGSAFSITVSKNVNLVVPTTAESPTVGRVQINNHGPTGYGTNYALYAGGTANQPYGIIFTTQVNTPTIFCTTSSGIWNMVQGVSPNQWTTPFQGTEQPDPKNGTSGLDTRYPFYPTSNSTFPQGIQANNLIAQPYDGPGIPNLLNTIVRYRIADTFLTFVMYLPPGNDVQYVPVWNIAWSMNADASIPTFWSAWNDANSPGTIQITGNAPTTVFPYWFTVISG